MRPRVHPAVRVRHAGLAVVVFVLAAVSVWFGGAGGIQSPFEQTPVFSALPTGEIIVVLHAALTAVLLHPRLMPWELRRRPTRWAAAGAAAWTVGSTAALAVVVRSRIIATYSTPEGQPQAEAVINNALFTAGVVLIGVVLLGPLRGAATGMAVYVAGYLVLMTRSTEFFWPLAAMTKPGAWWDPWTVAVTAAVVVVALVLHQRYAGATNRAVSHGE